MDGGSGMTISTPILIFMIGMILNREPLNHHLSENLYIVKMQKEEGIVISSAPIYAYELKSSIGLGR